MSDYEEGCYGDGSFGPDHTRRRVFEIALSENWGNQMDKEENEVFIRYWVDKEEIIRFEDIEMLDYIEECAVEYLNRDHSDDDHYWGYEHGDFGYWRINDEE